MITAGCVLWGIMTAGFATTHSVAQVGMPRHSLVVQADKSTLWHLQCLHIWSSDHILYFLTVSNSFSVINCPNSALAYSPTLACSASRIQSEVRNQSDAGLRVWAVNGVGLSLVIPNGQSLIADYYEDLDRGKAFGALYLTGAVGAMIGALYATNIGAPSGFKDKAPAIWSGSFGLAGHSSPPSTAPMPATCPAVISARICQQD